MAAAAAVKIVSPTRPYVLNAQVYDVKKRYLPEKYYVSSKIIN